MQIFSRRHKIVAKLVFTSLAITSIFGINSVFFSFSQNKLSKAIKRFEALDALIASTATDKISTIATLKKSYSLCTDNFPIKCENYFTSLIQMRNRMKDYEITFAETLDLSKEDKLYDFLTAVFLNTDDVAKDSFGISFEEAKREKIASAAEYIKFIQDKNYSVINLELTNKNLINSINLLYEKLNDWVKEDIKKSKSISQIMKEVNINYLILVFSEIILFILVCSIDIINNNVQNVIKE